MAHVVEVAYDVIGFVVNEVIAGEKVTTSFGQGGILTVHVYDKDGKQVEGYCFPKVYRLSRRDV